MEETSIIHEVIWDPTSKLCEIYCTELRLKDWGVDATIRTLMPKKEAEVKVKYMVKSIWNG